MATNRELRETAEALAQEVGVSVSVDGLGRKKLEELIESLEARKAPPPEEPSAPEVSDEPGATEQSAVVGALIDGFVQKSPPEDPPPQAQPSGPARYVVAPGVSFCCSKRGTIAPGQTITAADFGGDVEALHRQVVAGKIRKV